MNLRVLYPICSEPVHLVKVSDGLWVMGATESLASSTEEEYLRPVELFTQPMRSHKQGKEASHASNPELDNK